MANPFVDDAPANPSSERLVRAPAVHKPARDIFDQPTVVREVPAEIRSASQRPSEQRPPALDKPTRCAPQEGKPAARLKPGATSPRAAGNRLPPPVPAPRRAPIVAASVPPVSNGSARPRASALPPPLPISVADPARSLGGDAAQEAPPLPPAPQVWSTGGSEREPHITGSSIRGIDQEAIPMAPPPAAAPPELTARRKRHATRTPIGAGALALGAIVLAVAIGFSSEDTTPVRPDRPPVHAALALPAPPMVTVPTAPRSADPPADTGLGLPMEARSDGARSSRLRSKGVQPATRSPLVPRQSASPAKPVKPLLYDPDALFLKKR
jgi:hypothetical protein